MSALIFFAIFSLFLPMNYAPSNLASSYVPKVEVDIQPLQLVRKSRVMMVEASAYSHEESSNTTSLGKHLVPYETLAVDPTVIPYGSRVYFHSTGETYIAGDCGGYIVGNRVDKAMSNRAECFRYGRRYERVTVYFPEYELR